MGFVDWLLRTTNFPSGRRIGDAVSGSSQVIADHLAVLRASRRWNTLDIHFAIDQDAQYIDKCVNVLKSYHSSQMRITINIPASLNAAEVAQCSIDAAPVPEDDLECSFDRGEIVINFDADQPGDAVMAEFIHRIFADAYLCGEDFVLDIDALHWAHSPL
jgi:hypothetical protein